jgi:hypothetical protein
MSYKEENFENKLPPEFAPFFAKNSSEGVIENLEMISRVFKQIEDETAEVADMIFDYLINVADEKIMSGTIPFHKNPRINSYIKRLNRLFLLSRNASADKNGGIIIINRKTVQDLDKKTFTICMCHDGGVSLDVLCDIVNTENQARTPNNSPVKVTAKQFFTIAQDINLGR